MMAGTSYQFSFMPTREVFRNFFFRFLKSHGKKINMLTSLHQKLYFPKYSPGRAYQPVSVRARLLACMCALTYSRERVEMGIGIYVYIFP